VKTVASLMLCAALAAATPALGADAAPPSAPGPATAGPATATPADTITANYLLQCQKDPNACQVFTSNALRMPAPPQPGQVGDGRICAPLPLNRDQTNQLVQWILARPQQSTGHANDDIAMAGRAIWPCK
jgi:hypothetical protein